MPVIARVPSPTASASPQSGRWKRRLLAALLLAACACAAVPMRAQQPYGAPQYGPPMPLNVWALLRGQTDIGQRLSTEGATGNYPPAGWFDTIPVKLRLTGNDGLVVAEHNPPGSASAATYWVVLDVFTAPRVALRVEARDLRVEDRYSYGYRQLRAISAGGDGAYSTVFRYDGQSYQPVRTAGRGAYVHP